MKRALLCLAVLLACGSLLTAGDVTGIRCYEKVTPNGVETSYEVGPYVVNELGEVTVRNSAPGLVWDYPDSGLAWIGSCVSIGNRGTQVCGLCELNNERIELLSVFDGNPPVPIWTDASIHGTDAGLMCSSTANQDIHVVMYQVNNPDIYNRTPYVQLYESSSSTPAWTWNYEVTINAASKVAIDRKGTVVAVAVANNNTGMLDLFFLDPANGNVMSTYSQATPYGIRGFDLSADGSTVYFHDGGTNVYIFDIASNSVVYTTSTGGSFDGHCISGDGTKFAFGGFGNVKVYEFDGSTWSNFTFYTGSGNFADDMDFSDDGTTLGFGVTQYTPAYTKTEAYLLDIASQTAVSHAVFSSSGSYQDVCSGAAISADGMFFAQARWGDQFNAIPEVQILQRGLSTPIGSIDMRGSAFTVDISQDGQVTASGGKAIHANVSGNGGDFYCYDIGNEDVVVQGKPVVGGSFQLVTYGPDNWWYRPVMSSGEKPGGVSTQYGILYLDIGPSANWKYILSQAKIPAGGVAVDTLNVPNNPNLAGLTRYIQVVLAPNASTKSLSNDYVTVTVLP